MQCSLYGTVVLADPYEGVNVNNSSRSAPRCCIRSHCHGVSQRASRQNTLAETSPFNSAAETVFKHSRDNMATHQTATTQYVSSETTSFAYRRFGASEGVPLLFLIHFRGTMDKWDPLLINSVAKTRPVILVDYSGIGQSSGRVATSFRDSGADIITFLSLIGVSKVDILGFSIGAFVAQMVALNADPNTLQVRKLIIAGSSASVGPDMPETKNDYQTAATAGTLEVGGFKTLFFPRNKEGGQAADSWWARVAERNESASGEKASEWASQDLADGGAAMQAQGTAYGAFMNAEASKGGDGTYDRLSELKMPVLVAQGNVSSPCRPP